MSDVDALGWVMNSEADSGDRIEVHQVWGDVVVDVRQVAGEAAVSLGSTPAWRWRLLGVDMGHLHPAAARVLPWALPLFSEVVCSPAADFEVPSGDLPGEVDHVLVRDGAVRVVDGWSGFVDQGGERHPFSAVGNRVTGGWEIPLQAGSRVVVEVAGQVFQVRRTGLAKRAVARFGVDPGMVGVFGLVGALFAAVMAAAPATHRETVIAEVPDPIVQVAELVPVATRPVKTTKEGAKAKGDEGKLGVPERNPKPGGGRRDPTDREVAESAGILAAAGIDGPALSASLRAGVGALIGGRGVAIGTGLGGRGPGLGGGGTADGIGGLGLSGTGRDLKDFDGGKKQEGDLGVVEREIVAIGGIDRSMIDEVVKRHLSQIRYCYQRELNRDPDLGGKVVVKFTIGGDGAVAAAATKSSSLGNATVESCINGRFLRMNFPAPRGGGVAIVSYPFLFSPG